MALRWRGVTAAPLDISCGAVSAEREVGQDRLCLRGRAPAFALRVGTRGWGGGCGRTDPRTGGRAGGAEVTRSAAPRRTALVRRVVCSPGRRRPGAGSRVWACSPRGGGDARPRVSPRPRPARGRPPGGGTSPLPQVAQPGLTGGGRCRRPSLSARGPRARMRPAPAAGSNFRENAPDVGAGFFFFFWKDQLSGARLCSKLFLRCNLCFYVKDAGRGSEHRRRFRPRLGTHCDTVCILTLGKLRHVLARITHCGQDWDLENDT